MAVQDPQERHRRGLQLLRSSLGHLVRALGRRSFSSCWQSFSGSSYGLGTIFVNLTRALKPRHRRDRAAISKHSD